MPCLCDVCCLHSTVYTVPVSPYVLVCFESFSPRLPCKLGRTDKKNIYIYIYIYIYFFFTKAGQRLISNVSITSPRMINQPGLHCQTMFRSFSSLWAERLVFDPLCAVKVCLFGSHTEYQGLRRTNGASRSCLD